MQNYTSRTNNAFVAGGLLHIHAQQENTSPITISSARMKTQGKFATLYGRIEWRAKLPAGVTTLPGSVADQDRLLAELTGVLGG